MLSQNPADSINLLWNEQMMKNQANSMMYMTPSFNASIWEFPEFAMYGNYLTSPNLAFNQFMSRWNNNGNMFSGFNFGNIGDWFNNINPFPVGGSNSSTNTSGMTDEEKNKVKKMEREYNNLRKLLETYQNVSGQKDENLLEEIKTALSNNGSAPKDASEEEKKRLPIERKLDALKKVYNKLDKNDLRRTMSLIELSDANFKKELEKAGYRFNAKEYSYKNADDVTLNNTLDLIHSEISQLSPKNPNSTTNLKSLIEPMATDGQNGILRVISYWNDKYNDEKTERSIIRFIGKQYNAIKDSEDKDGNAKKEIKTQISLLTSALTSRANYIKENSEGIAEASLNALNQQIANVSKTKEKFVADGSKSTLGTLCNEFEKLYVMLRKIEANKINAEIKAKYSFLNDISSTDTDFVDGELIVKDTEADLAAEGLQNINVNIQVEETPENKPSAVTKEVLERDGISVSVKCSNGRVIPAYKYDEKYYKISDDGKVKEISSSNIAEVTVVGGAAPVDGGATKLPTADDLKKDGTKTTIDSKDFYLYDGSFYLLKGGQVLAGEKIEAYSKDSRLRKQEYYKFDGVIYHIKDGKIEKASADVTEKNN